MRSWVKFLGILQHRSGDLPERHCRSFALGLLSAFVLVFGMLGRVDAQTSRYTLDDVMDKLNDMDKRLVRMETKVDMLEKRVDGLESSLNGRVDVLESSLNGRMDSLQTMVLSLFGLLGALFAGILAFVFSIARSLKPEPPRDVMEELRRMRERMEEIAEREKALEEALASRP